jgi:hypothetical protein
MQSCCVRLQTYPSRREDTFPGNVLLYRNYNTKQKDVT